MSEERSVNTLNMQLNSTTVADVQIQMSSLGTGICGRFGNQIFQYIFLQIVQQELGCRIAYPHWMGELVFEVQSKASSMNSQPHLAAFEKGIADVNTIPLIAQTQRYVGPTTDVNALRSYIERIGAECLDVYGYFQYHTGCLRPWRKEIQKWLKLRLSPSMDANARLRALVGDSEKNILAVHVRRGDYLQYGRQHPYFWGASVDDVVKTISDILDGGAKNVVIYLCSDDLDYCSTAFRERNVPHLTWRELDSGATTDQQLMHDFSVMTGADMLLAGNSSLSIAASLLNEKGRMFLRPSPRGDGMVPYVPWSTEILLSQT